MKRHVFFKLNGENYFEKINKYTTKTAVAAFVI